MDGGKPYEPNLINVNVDNVTFRNDISQYDIQVAERPIFDSNIKLRHHSNNSSVLNLVNPFRSSNFEKREIFMSN